MPEPADSAILTSLRLTKALGLARQGKLKPAQLLLAPEDGIPASATELHALAALVTHEGNYLRALALWKQLAQHQPDHAEARRMIPMIELWLSRPAWHRYAPFGLGALAVAASVGIALWFLRPANPPLPKKPAATASPSANAKRDFRPRDLPPGDAAGATSSPHPGRTFAEPTSALTGWRRAGWANRPAGPRLDGEASPSRRPFRHAAIASAIFLAFGAIPATCRARPVSVQSTVEIVV